MFHHHFTSATQALTQLTEDLYAQMLRKGVQEPFFLALSGGETAQQLFRLWSAEFAQIIPWQHIRFFWVDERCVGPEDPESNYGWAKKLLFDPLPISPEQIFRIQGEAPPQEEVRRYNNLIISKLNNVDYLSNSDLQEPISLPSPLPRFDAAILGIGTDAHTASIFPADLRPLSLHQPYTVSQHPQSGRQRITATGPMLLNVDTLLVPCFGFAKKEVIQGLLNKDLAHSPAGYILSQARHAVLYTA